MSNILVRYSTRIPRVLRNSSYEKVYARSFKNMGHGREFTPLPTVLWHGFLSFTLIGLFIDWKWVGKILKINEELTQGNNSTSTAVNNK